MFNYLVNSPALLQSYGSCLLWIAGFFLLHRVLRLLSMPPAIFHVVNVVPIMTFLMSELDDVPIHLFVLWIGLQLIIAAWLAWVVGNQTRNTPNTPNGYDELEKNLVAYSRWEERIRLLPVFAIAVAVGVSLHFLLFENKLANLSESFLFPQTMRRQILLIRQEGLLKDTDLRASIISTQGSERAAEFSR